MSPKAVLEGARRKVAVVEGQGFRRGLEQLLFGTVVVAKPAVVEPPMVVGIPIVPVEPEAPVVSERTRKAIETIQWHIDREARNRRKITLAPKDMCPLQKAEMVQDLGEVLGFR